MHLQEVAIPLLKGLQNLFFKSIYISMYLFTSYRCGDDLIALYRSMVNAILEEQLCSMTSKFINLLYIMKGRGGGSCLALVPHDTGADLRAGGGYPSRPARGYGGAL